MISKELLSEVTPHLAFCDDITEDENEFVFWKDGEMHSDINIYELAHKCKEWAHGKDYFISSKIIPFGNSQAYISYQLNNECHRVKADTEPDAIFKACEWILSNKI